MDKDKVGIMMHSAKKVPISDLSDCITCKLCKGYFIDATTIIECLHTFCRSCIVRYLESNKYCPICDVQVHKTKPFLNIRHDKTIQDLVYKLVPRLYYNESQRRRTYYESHPDEKPTVTEQNLFSQYEYILAPEETINLTLQYYGNNEGLRYLRCPSAVSISHLQKLLRIKYELTEHHKIEMFYDQDCLNWSLSLMDIAYIYSWKKQEPLHLTYKIYESRAKKPKLEDSETDSTVTNNLQNNNNNNNNNWKEVQLRISENGEMSITGIQDAIDIDIPEKEIIINESKPVEENQRKPEEKSDSGIIVVTEPKVDVASSVEMSPKKQLPELKFIGKSTENSCAPITTTAAIAVAANLPEVIIPKSAELSDVLNLTSSELSVIPLSTNKACTTTTVFSTINKTMCSAKPAEKPPVEVKLLKRKSENEDKGPPAKLPKPTILNHSIGLLNMCNNHSLNRHKLNRNGEAFEKSTPVSSVANNVAVTTSPQSKPISINRNVNVSGPIKNIEVKTSTVPCYTPKVATERSKDKADIRPVKIDINSTPKTSTPSTTHHQHPIHIPIITPSQLPHNQIHSTHQLKSSPNVTTSAAPAISSLETTISSAPSINHESCRPPAIKTKPSTPIGYKTLRNPPKSWNSQISMQIAKNTSIQNRQAPSDLKNVRPQKFFKGRNMPRYLGNPASGVKPMYQVQVSPEKDKNHVENAKVEKREIKKHSIVKIDPKTLKPISEKAPETSNLSNVSVVPVPQANQDLRLNSTPSDLKINTSSVSIFNPLKLQSSPKGDRKSPKSPHSPKVKVTSSASASVLNSTVFPKQHRDKTSLTFTPSSPFIPNLSSPTLRPNWPFPTYDPRVMAAYHNLLYRQSMVAAAAAGLVPPAVPQSFGLNMAMKTSHSPNVLPKQSVSMKNEPKKLETALERLAQNKAKELGAAAKTLLIDKPEIKAADNPKSDKEKNGGNLPENETTKNVRKEAPSLNVVPSKTTAEDVPPVVSTSINNAHHVQEHPTKKTETKNGEAAPAKSNSQAKENEGKPVLNGEQYTDNETKPPQVKAAPPSGKNINDSDSSRVAATLASSEKSVVDADSNKKNCDNKSEKKESVGDGNEKKGSNAEIGENGCGQSVGA